MGIQGHSLVRAWSTVGCRSAAPRRIVEGLLWEGARRTQQHVLDLLALHIRQVAQELRQPG